MNRAADFWNRFAERYAARPIRDVDAYEAMLAETASWLRADDRVLEIGCGTGGTAIRLAAGVSCYVATDFSKAMIRIAEAKAKPSALRFLLAEAADLPRGGPFDAICAFNVLHLVEDLPGLLRRLRGGLAPGGRLICKTWCFGDLPLRFRLLFRVLRLARLFPPAHFMTREALEQAIGEAGFAIIATRSFGSRAENPWIVAQATDEPSAGAKEPKPERASGAGYQTVPTA